MPAAVVSIDYRPTHRAIWSLLEVVPPGVRPIPFGVLLADEGDGPPSMRFRDVSCLAEPDEGQIDILDFFPGDFESKGREMTGEALIASLEESLSHFIRISDRTTVEYSGDPGTAVDRLFAEHVDATLRSFVTHLPLYSLEAAATKFGELMDAAQEGWVLTPRGLRLASGMFVARVVGRSMEPRISDGSLCVFRAPVIGSRQGKLLLIEMFDGDDISQRYTVKKYARTGGLVEAADREQSTRLEPLNPEFEAFNLDSDQFRVVAEFVQELHQA